MPRLDNIRHEVFARGIAKGLPKVRAYANAGYNWSNSNAIHLWRDKGTTSHKIQRRVMELVDKAKDLTADDILDRVLVTYELASESGQHSAALKAMEMLGRQKGLFTERKEHVNINIQQMSQAQLESYMHEKYGDRADAILALLSNRGISENNHNTTDTQARTPLRLISNKPDPANA